MTWLCLAGAVACSVDARTAIRGTTVRVGEPKTKGETGAYSLRIFASDADCGSDSIRDDLREKCLPYIDRATGTVHLAFQLLVDGTPSPMAFRPDAITVLHDKRNPASNGEDRVRIVPRQPASIGHLFVLLIDGSGSMAAVDNADGVTRMDKLRRALLRKDVVDAFFSGGSAGSSVAPLVFRGGLPAPLGGKWVVSDPDEYKRLIKGELSVGSGYTYLYQAIQYAAIGLHEQPEIKKAVDNKGLSPTIIALTDGFNNERPEDTCGANAPRLQGLLTELQLARIGKKVAGYQPDIFTVGLGVRAWKRFKVPDDLNVVPGKLCKQWSDSRIDGNVENLGVDNAALSWIAKVGGGDSYVRRDADGLAEAFKAAAQDRHTWFDLYYKVDPFYLRRGFDVTIRLNSPYQVEATVPIHPNGWLDGPPGVAGEDGWPGPASFRNSLSVLMAILSVLIIWNYAPAALFNVRRALFGVVGRKG